MNAAVNIGALYVSLAYAKWRFGPFRPSDESKRAQTQARSNAKRQRPEPEIKDQGESKPAKGVPDFPSKSGIDP